MAVAAPAPQTSPMATPTFPSATGMMMVVIYVRVLNYMLMNESDGGVIRVALWLSYDRRWRWKWMYGDRR